MLPNLTFRNLLLFVFVVIAPLSIGWWVAEEAIPQPAVGIVTMNTDIWLGSANIMMKQIEKARLDERIKAVVLRIDSPGGAVVPTQELYMEMQNLRHDMPVVGLINTVAASGGFYLAMGADPIYAKPSSMVGNVGVWSVVPPEMGVNDKVIASGPFKLSASNRDEFMRQIEGIKQEFLATVYSQRGERVTISRAELSQGLAYPGRDALNYGLIDGLGSQTNAIEKAAELAGLRDYEVIDLQEIVFDELFTEQMPLFLQPWDENPWFGAANPLTGERYLPPGVYLLYDVRLGGIR